MLQKFSKLIYQKCYTVCSAFVLPIISIALIGLFLFCPSQGNHQDGVDYFLKYRTDHLMALILTTETLYAQTAINLAKAAVVLFFVSFFFLIIDFTERQTLKHFDPSRNISEKHKVT